MNLLITGALGHIGSGLIEKVTKIKNLKNIYLLDSARSNNLNVLFNLRAKKIKFKFLFEDLNNKDSLNSIDKKNVYVATDDKRIQEHCLKNKMQVIMTSKKCKTGTDRIYEFSKKINSDIYITVLLGS